MRARIVIEFDDGTVLAHQTYPLVPGVSNIISCSLPPTTEEGVLFLTGFEFKPWLEYRTRTSTAPDTETNSSDDIYSLIKNGKWPT